MLVWCDYTFFQKGVVVVREPHSFNNSPAINIISFYDLINTVSHSRCLLSAGIVARNGSGTVATETSIDSVLVAGTITGTSNTATGQHIGLIHGQISVGKIDVSNAYSENTVYTNKNISAPSHNLLYFV